MTAPIQPTGPILRSVERVEYDSPFKNEGSSFGDALKRALSDASELQDNSKELIEAFLRGEPVELHQVMAAGEEAAISIEILVEIRNKLTEAYRSVMNVS